MINELLGVGFDARTLARTQENGSGLTTADNLVEFRPMRVAALYAFALLISPGSRAEENAFKQGTTGSYIEAQLKTLVGGCFGADRYKDVFMPAFYTTGSMRANLEKPLDADRQINDFSFEFLSKSVVDPGQTFISQVGSVRSIRNQLAFDMPPASALQTISTSSYAFNCTTSLKVALDQGFSFPRLAGPTDLFKQAINFQTDASRSNSLLVLYGAFRSPFDIAVRATDNPSSSVGAHASAWRYYIENKTPYNTIRATSMYLPVIRGWLMRWDTSGGMAAFLNSSLSAGGSGWGLSANLGADAKLQFNTKSAATAFSVILDQPISSSDLVALPGPKDIEGAVRRATSFRLVNDIPYILNVPTSVKALIPGLPGWLCVNAWSASTTTSGISVGNVNATPTAGNTGCDLDVSLTFTSPATVVNVLLENHGFPIQIDDQTAVKISILKTLNFTQLNSPVASPFGATRIVAIDQQNFSAQVPFTILPKRNVKNVEMDATATVVCDGIDVASIQVQPPRILPDAAGDMLMQVNFSNSKGALSPPANCTVTGKVNYVYSAPTGDVALVRPIISKASISAP